MSNDPMREAREWHDHFKMKLVYVKRWRTLIPLPTKYADEILAALALPVPRDREAVIEECARIADNEVSEPTHSDQGEDWNIACRTLANGIRALKSPPAGEEGR